MIERTSCATVREHIAAFQGRLSAQYPHRVSFSPPRRDLKIGDE